MSTQNELFPFQFYSSPINTKFINGFMLMIVGFNSTVVRLIQGISGNSKQTGWEFQFYSSPINTISNII